MNLAWRDSIILSAASSNFSFFNPEYIKDMLTRI